MQREHQLAGWHVQWHSRDKLMGLQGCDPDMQALAARAGWAASGSICALPGMADVITADELRLKRRYAKLVATQHDI